MKKSIYFFALACAVACNTAQPVVEECTELGPYPQIVNAYARAGISLDGEWQAIVDQYENGYYDYRLEPMADEKTFFADRDWFKEKTKLIEYSFDTDMSLNVPGDWNTQRPELYYYEGTIWYRKKLELDPRPDKRYFLYFAGANYETIVGVNGKKKGRHIGGFTPFNFEVTSDLKAGENSIIAKVDNKRHPEGVPTVNSDWWNYGGITRDVMLLELPETFIRDYYVRLPKGEYGRIAVSATIDGSQAPGARLVFSIPELGITSEAVADAGGKVEFSVDASPELWSPASPKLYSVTLACCGDSVSDEIGFRNIETRGTEILLNGEKIYCKGVCVHEEKPYAPSGRACGTEDAKQLLAWAKEMNCNFLRLAHYPHNEAMVREAEREGFMVWSEIPVYWTIHWDNPTTYANAEAQLVEEIKRDANRANIIIWSVANETPQGESRLKFLSSLMDKAREMDPTRLVSAAMEKEYVDTYTLTVDDALVDKADLISFNQYVGWYDGDSEKCDSIVWTFSTRKPVIITEFGGGCKAGFHGDVTERFSEEYLTHLYEKNVAMLDRIDALAGSTPWVLKDFRSPRRQLKQIQDDFNRKGLVSEDGVRKDAFYVMRDWYAGK